MAALRKTVKNPKRFQITKAELAKLKLQPDDIVEISVKGKKGQLVGDDEPLRNHIPSRHTTKLVTILVRDLDYLQEIQESHRFREAYKRLKVGITVSDLKNIGRYARENGYEDWQTFVLTTGNPICNHVGPKTIELLTAFIDKYNIEM